MVISWRVMLRTSLSWNSPEMRSSRYGNKESLFYIFEYSDPTDCFPQIIPESYQNEARRIHIPDLPQEIIPGSPEDLQIPVPPSGVTTPLAGGLGSPQEGIGTPQSGLRTPREPERITQQHVEDVV